MEGKLKRVVIKEELVHLTGDYFKAILLNQFIYWSERVYDFDKFIEEERERMKQDGQELNMLPTKGWIYKTAEELADETMLGVSVQTIGRHLKVLIDQGYLLQRNNPEHKWDRTKQYRVNLTKIRKDLESTGYVLEGYAMLNAISKMENANSTVEDANSKMENGDSVLENQDSILEDQSVKNGRAIPKTTTETTYKDYITTTSNPRRAIIKRNISKANPVVVVDEQTMMLQQQIESLLRVPLSPAVSQKLQAWLYSYGRDYILDKAKYVGEMKDKRNPIGSFIHAIEHNWETSFSSALSQSVQTKPIHDERYTNFYKLFPEH